MSRPTIASLKNVWMAIVMGSLLCVGPVLAGEINKHGDAFVVYLPGNLDYLEVVDRLKTEIMAANWEITDVQDVDVGLRQYGVNTQNKVISACRSQLLARAIKDDPYISLAVPCRFTVFRDEANDRIVVGFHDPAKEAKALKIGKYQAAEQATDELKGVLQVLADFYQQ